MWLILQEDNPGDYVAATGETHTVREFVEISFASVGIYLSWKGEGIDEVGFDKNVPDRTIVKIDSRYFRPTEVDLLLGDATKAKTTFGWEAKTKFADLVNEMVLADLALVDAGDFAS